MREKPTEPAAPDAQLIAAREELEATIRAHKRIMKLSRQTLSESTEALARAEDLLARIKLDRK